MAEKCYKELLLILQLSDSAFPTGGFSHSLGYESSRQHKFVISLADAKNFVLALLENTASKALPFVREAHAQCSDVAQVERLDKSCEACLLNHVENRASRRQGSALLNTACSTFTDVATLPALQERLVTCHQAVTWGAVCGCMGISVENACSAYMSNALRGVLAATVRLDSVGSLQAQKIHYECQKLIPEIIQRHCDVTSDDAYTSFPVIDTMQQLQDTMFSKLFYS